MAPTTLALTDLVAPTTGPEIHPFAYTRGGLPIWPVCGAEDDDDTEDDDSDDQSDDNDSEGEGGEGEYKAPTEEEWKRTQAALARANREAKRLRLKAKGTTPKEDEDAAAKAVADAEKRFKPVAIRSAAKAAFMEAGLNDASEGRVKKLLKLIDMDDVDVDEDGDVTGLEDQVDAIKEDYPELFAAPKQERKRATRLEASNRSSGGGTDKPKRTADRIAAAVLAGK